MTFQGFISKKKRFGKASLSNNIGDIHAYLVVLHYTSSDAKVSLQSTAHLNFVQAGFPKKNLD